MVCVPGGKELVLKEAVATPLLFMTLTGLPMLLPSTWNWTVPVGPLPRPLAATVAVKVTLRPISDGFAEEVTVVVVDTVGEPVKTCIPATRLRLPPEETAFCPPVAG